MTKPPILIEYLQMENIKNDGGYMSIFTNTYSKIALALATLAALSLYPIYKSLNKQKPCIAVFANPSKQQVEQTIQEITNSEGNLATTLKEQLVQENTQLLARIPLAFPQIHPLQWENAMKSVQKIKANDDLLSKEPINIAQLDVNDFSNVIYATLAEYGINPARVEIEFVSTPQSFLSACQGLNGNKVRHIIRVNLEQVNKKSPQVALAYLRHEIQHLLTYDAIELMIIKDVFEKNEISPEEYYINPDFIELKKFKEYRADLLAATKDMSTAQAFMEDMEERIKLYPHEQVNPSHATHPTETQRKQAIANLAQYMQIEKQHVIA